MADLEWIPAPDFDLEQTLHSGQAFRWVPHEGGQIGVIDRTPVFLRARDGGLEVTRGATELASHYLALDHPIGEFHATFPSHPYMLAALEACRGLRILRQPLWECTAAFICSAQKQVAHIRQLQDKIAAAAGELVGSIPGRDRQTQLFAFPSAEAVASLGEQRLRSFGLGYRAPNLARSAELIASGSLDLEALRPLPTRQIRERLIELPGVGPKIAECILLFGYGRLEAIPIDVWIGRILRVVFARGRAIKAARMPEYAARKLGPFAGYAQQILFHHARQTWPKGTSKVA